eukprot:NODE_630_length_5791_cov_0.338370.p3 type:complete len:188 gc:universal NODE_630_length_5791_cov_0.338370:5357-4794(-)
MYSVKSFVPLISQDFMHVDEIKPKTMYINTGFLSGCHGSCLLESGDELIIARVILHPCTQKGSFFIVECKSNESISHSIQKSMFPCICFSEIPNTVIRVQIEVLSGKGDFNCINAVSLALIDANIPMLGIVSGHCENTTKEKALMVCCKEDVTHCILDGDLTLFDQCYEGCQNVKNLITSHFHQKYK